MKIDYITERLVLLASLPYQKRYLVNGTVNEYVVPEELLDIDELEHLLTRPENRLVVTSEQMAALNDLCNYIHKHRDTALPAEKLSDKEFNTLIQESDVWNTIRTMATTTLTLFGVSVETMSVEDIDQMME